MRHGPSQDYYALLGIAPSATASQLRSAWRQLALKWHPDRAGDAATATFQKLQAAYTVLADPIARAKYDRRRGEVPRSPRAAPSVMLRRLCGPLNGLLMCGVALTLRRVSLNCLWIWMRSRRVG